MPALIFDCDGVLADTERDGHLPAFNQTFAEVGPAGAVVGGGVRREAADRRRQGAHGVAADAPSSCAPTACPTDPEGQTRAAGRLAPAQDRALQGDRCARAGCPAAPGHRPHRRARRSPPAGRWPSPRPRPRSRCGRCSSTSSAPSDAARFAVFAGDVVPAKKPDPAIYLLALERARASRRDDAIVVEDSRNGLLAAVGAGLRCVVTVSGYTARRGHERGGARRPSLGDPGEPARVLANRSAARPGDEVTLADLEALPARTPARRGGCMSDTALRQARAGRPDDRPDGGRQRDVLLRARRRRRRRRLRLLAGPRLRDRARATGTSSEYDDVGGLLKKTALVLTRRIGGTSGPIWGTAFLRAGVALTATPEPERRRGHRRAARGDRGHQAARRRRPRRQDAARRARARRSTSSRRRWPTGAPATALDARRPTARAEPPRRPRGCSPSAAARPTRASAAATRSTPGRSASR